MNTNRKVRPQPSLASLTTDEYHQLADMVCTRTYESVRQQVNKPRSEGGFDLNISVKPLQVLHARVQRLNKINEQFASGQKLTLTAYDEIHAGEKRATEEVHDAIMSATYLLVTEQDNTPHQLLALQRLADFPARAELREQTAQIRAQSAQDLSRLRNQSLAHRTERQQFARAKEARAEAKELRAQELHTLKIHRLSSANHGVISRDEIDYNDALDNHDAIPSDRNLSEKTQHSALSTQNSNTASSSFLSPAVLANTRLYDQKVACGEIRHIFTPGKHYEIEYCNPADKPALERTNKSAPLRFVEDPSRTHFLPGLRTFGKNPYIPPATTADKNATTGNHVNPVHSVESPSSFSSSSAAPLSTLNPQLSTSERNSTPQTFPSKTEP